MMTRSHLSRCAVRRLMRMFGLGILLLIVSAALPRGISRSESYQIAGVALVVIPFAAGLLWLCFAMIRAGWQMGRQIGLGVRAYQQPLPTPQEIEQALTQHLGRPPTLREIADLQQILANERRAKINDGLVGAAGLVAMDLIGREKL